MRNNEKMKFNLRKNSAITLAEIMIVVVILAILACIFLAMPRKNVSAVEKTKYYIAYSTLQRLLSEQLADNGKIALNNNSVVAPNCVIIATDEEKQACEEVVKKFSTATFKSMVDKWLNVASSSTNNARLTNGMVLDWTSSAKDKTENGIKIEKVVSIDIDGPDEGRSVDKKDKHYFLLYRKYDNTTNTYGDIKIKPVSPSDESTLNSSANTVPTSNDAWITFKVFDIKDNGDMKIRLLDQDYTNSYNCYENKTDACSNNCTPDKCFIEPIPPVP